MAKYAVIRTDNMAGTDTRSMLVSARYFDSNGKMAEIENGCVVKVEELIEGERELFKAVDVAADDELKDVVILAAPEVPYDERLRNLEDYINEEGKNIRGYRFHTGDIFSLTLEGFVADATPVAGDIVELAAGTKLKVVKEATAGSTTVGKIHDVEVAGRHTFYAVKVD